MIENKYAKIENEETKAVSVGIGNNEDYYKSIGMVKMDVEQSYDGNWYVAGYAPQKSHNQVIMEQIYELENQITERNMRSAIMGDQFAINKITEIEAQIEELRKQLEPTENAQ